MTRSSSNRASGYVAFGLSFAAAMLVLASSPAATLERTDVKMRTDAKSEPQDRPGRLPGVRVPLTIQRSLAAGHAGAIQPYVPIPDTEDTHTLHVESR
jgi:hypothetical protein